MNLPVTLTVTFPSFDAAAAFLAGQQPPVIAADDRPDVGAEPASVPAPPALSNPFAVAEAAVVPAAPTAPTAPPAPAAAPTPASAPAATAAVPLATGVVLDSAGLPWDGRIHGTTKTQNGDGTWRQKRGLNDPTLKARVEAELRAGQAARAPAATEPVASSAPAPESVSAAGPATTPPTAAGETFGQLMARLAPVTMGDPAKAAKLNEALAAFQLTSLAQLAARPDLVAPFAQTADAMLA